MTVVIGTQEWMIENLRTSRYQDGTPIPLLEANSVWEQAPGGAYCWYVHWLPPNTGASNSTTFTGLPGGIRSFSGSFQFQGQYGSFWSRSLDCTGDAWSYSLSSGSAGLGVFLED